MIAVDTNVLVRLLVADDPRQAATARKLFSSDTIWIAKTVLLETEWVLRSAYDLDRGAVSAAFTALLGVPNIEVEDEPSVAAALAAASAGLDFADALHLSSRPDGAAFVTFDQSLARRAARAGLKDVAAV